MPRRDPRLDVDIRKQRPNRPVFAPHRSPHESSRQPGNHAKQTNTSDFSVDFFSSLLKRLDRFADRLHSAMNRATIGIMTASLVVGSSIVMTVAEGPRLFGVSLLTYCGLVGYLVAFANSLWIIFSIWRSSRK